MVFTATTMVAQSKISEGIIISKQTLESDDENMKAQLAMLGEIMSTTYFKKDKSRSEVSSPMTGDAIVIMDFKTKDQLMLMNNPMLGKVYAKSKTDNGIDKIQDVQITEVDETKQILGFNCKRYDMVLNVDGIDLKSTYYTTEEIDLQHQETAKFGKDFKGFPMYMEMEVNQMGMKMIVKHEVTEIREEKVEDSKFDMTIPEGYKENKMLLGQN